MAAEASSEYECSAKSKSSIGTISKASGLVSILAVRLVRAISPCRGEDVGDEINEGEYALNGDIKGGDGEKWDSWVLGEVRTPQKGAP